MVTMMRMTANTYVELITCLTQAFSPFFTITIFKRIETCKEPDRERLYTHCLESTTNIFL